MPNELWSQDIFSKGELSPYMYARATVNEYGNGLKKAQNVLTYPTGAAGKRFGTLYQATLGNTVETYKDIYFETFQYLSECVYQLVFSPLNIAIYLEGYLMANVATTLTQANLSTLSTTTVGDRFQVCSFNNFRPSELIRTDSTVVGIAVTIASSTTLLLSSGSVGVGQILPIRFTTTGALPTTTPQILAGITYFAKFTTATAFTIHSTAYNAKFNIEPFAITPASGSGVNSVFMLNNWAFNNITFKNVPSFDFNSKTTSYTNINFQTNSLTGTAVITLSSPYAPLTTSYIGGAFIGFGGSGRIINVISTTVFHVSVQTPFNSVPIATNVIGSLVYLAEPAWSNTRGWPQVCSSYQNRALYANSTQLPNGFWASVINDYYDFGDLTSDDDDAISWYPSSNNVNFIRFIVPYRSVTVHTNTGIYSSPLSDVSAITPSNFTLQLQDSTPADVLLPQSIDNQVLVLSGNDAHQMLWDGINNAYTSDIVSIISEQTIRSPVDEVAYADLRRAGSRYVFIINANGTMAVFQTLISQNVSGFTPQIMEQSYGDAKFLQAASSADGRCWFIVQRDVAQAQPPVAITGFTSTTLQATGLFYPTDESTAMRFTTSGTLPASPDTTIGTNIWYWAVGTGADSFKLYLSKSDADADINPIQFTSAGTGANSVPWPKGPIFTMEELSHDTYLDCAVYYKGAATATVNTGALFNAQDVKMVGDEYGFTATGINNGVTFTAHGVSQSVSEAYIGFPINTIIEPMPLSMANGPSAKNTTLTKPKHVRFVNFMFNDTIGGTINGVPIALKPFNQVNIGTPPQPARGYFQMAIMKGWDDFNNPTYTIEHNEPFNIELLGAFYSVDI